MPTSSATNNHTIQVTRHRNPLHAYSIMIHWLKVYELILCSENKENDDCIDQGRSPIEANIRTCGRSEGLRRNKIYDSRKRKKSGLGTMPAEPTSSCRLSTRMKPLDPISSITIELWRPPASPSLATSSSRSTETLFL